MPSTLLLLGAGGDLSRRYLLPALAHLQRAGRLPDALTIIGVGREDGDDDAFRQQAAAALAEHAAEVDFAHRAALCRQLRYVAADVTSAEDLRPIVRCADGPVLVYLALPHTLFAATVTALLALGGDSLTGFALALILGTIAGTISTVSVAVPLTVALDRRWPPRPEAPVAAGRRTSSPRREDGAVV
ncbi:hypothetical protein [Blastococcus sp. TF02A-35]|uniref:hypothetical protein n=1 Tax=Blastococcus sp. TF02A-35 TaxID=2559612 RepID=UPI001ADD7524|nr:hypothetical protein [Blastococcus sp. TF02A_35]